MILYYSVVALHVIVCIILVLVVLLQSGRGADLAGAFGGGATQTAFGSRGPASFLSKMTTVAAVVFMITSIALSVITFKKEASRSILETTTKRQTTQPVKKAPAGKPAVTLSPEQIQKVQEQAEEAARKRKEAAQAPAPAPANQPAAKPVAPKPPTR
jgi:preprotein translocase subunit SecG